MVPGYDSYNVSKDMHTKFGEASSYRGRAININKNFNTGVDANADTDADADTDANGDVWVNSIPLTSTL